MHCLYYERVGATGWSPLRPNTKDDHSFNAEGKPTPCAKNIAKFSFFLEKTRYNFFDLFHHFVISKSGDLQCRKKVFPNPTQKNPKKQSPKPPNQSAKNLSTPKNKRHLKPSK